MNELFARYLTPLTYLLWALIIIGGIDHFAIEVLPRPVADINLIVMMPLLAAVWFGHKHKARMQATRDDFGDGA